MAGTSYRRLIGNLSVTGDIRAKQKEGGDTSGEQVANFGEKAAFSRHEMVSDNRKKSSYGLINQSFNPNRSRVDSENTRDGKTLEFFSHIKAWCYEFLYQNISFLESQLVFSMIFGGSGLIPDEFRHYFKVTGMLHVAAASGANISMICQLASIPISRFQRRWHGALGLLGIIFFYVGIAGLSSTLVRASLMASFSLLASWVFHRSFRTIWGWGMSGVVMVFFKPSLIEVVSFQLSMTATLGIILFGNLWTRDDSWLKSWELSTFSANPLPKNFKCIQQLALFVKEATALTVAAQILTLPLLLHHFHELATISIIANIALGWLTPVITLGGLILLLLGSLSMFAPFLRIFISIGGLVVTLITRFFLKGLQILGEKEETLWKFSDFSWHFVVIWWICTFFLYIKMRKRPSKIRYFWEKNGKKI